MKHVNPISFAVLAASIGLISSVSVSGAAGPKIGDSASRPSIHGTDTEDALRKLKSELVAAISAIKTNDMEKAKKHYRNFHTEWKGSFEGVIEVRSETTYEVFSQAEDNVETNLLATQIPKKHESIVALQRLLALLTTSANID